MLFLSIPFSPRCHTAGLQSGLQGEGHKCHWVLEVIGSMSHRFMHQGTEKQAGIWYKWGVSVAQSQRLEDAGHVFQVVCFNRACLLRLCSGARPVAERHTSRCVATVVEQVLDKSCSL